jgi:hypothetical protein
VLHVVVGVVLYDGQPVPVMYIVVVGSSKVLHVVVGVVLYDGQPVPLRESVDLGVPVRGV